MAECAFCMKTAKLSGEHIHSDWMNKILPGKWVREFKSSLGHSFTQTSNSLNWKARVVCDECNSGWMSDIEADHAKPVMAPLILGNMNIPIDLPEARSIALFAFKTAVVLDMLRNEPGRLPFYSQRIRTAFMDKLTIPSNVNMWLCPYVTTENRADVFSGYNHGELSLMGPVQMHVCTFGAGSFAFQVLTVKTFSRDRIVPDGTFDSLSVPFWPQIRRGFVWPPNSGLRSVEEFTAYHRRWEICSPLFTSYR